MSLTGRERVLQAYWRRDIAGQAVTSANAGDGLTIVNNTLSVGAGTGISVSGTTVGLDLAASLTWTGDQTFQGDVVARNVLPEAADTYDLGSESLPWRRLYASEMDTTVFAVNSIQLVGGYLMVPHGQGVLPGAVAAEATTIDFGAGHQVAENDFLLFRGLGQDEYMQVGAVVSGNEYNVTRHLLGAWYQAWPAGTPYVVLGYDGDGRLELDAQSPDGTPRLSIYTQGTTLGAVTEVVRLGNMNGWGGVAADYYGIGLGDYAGGNYLTYDTTGGLLLKGGDGNVQLSASGLWLANDGTGSTTSAAVILGDDPTGNGTYGKLVYYDYDAYDYLVLEAVYRTGGADHGSATMRLDPVTPQIHWATGDSGLGHDLMILDHAGDLRLLGGLYVGDLAVDPGADEIWSAADVRIGAGLYVGATNVDPDAGDVYYTSDLRPVRGGTTYTGYTFVPLAAPLTSTSYDGNDTVAVGTVTVDTSAAFSAPAGIKACLVFAQAKWASAADANVLGLRPVGASSHYGLIRAKDTGYVAGQICTACDSNGDFDLVVAGADATEVLIRILGYWL